jgi:hypothetical protein
VAHGGNLIERWDRLDIELVSLASERPKTAPFHA